MTDIQFPVSVTELFSAFGVTDPARILIILLSLVLGILLVFILLIAFRGRPSDSKLSNQKEDAADQDRAETPAAKPIIPKATRPEGGDPLAAQSLNKIENSELAAELGEDFQIFKRPRQKSNPAEQTTTSLEVTDRMSTPDHLRLIEKEMVRLRDLYQSGHITRDMYIDETQSLYIQARELSSIS